jgi:hypothetical protein
MSSFEDLLKNESYKKLLEQLPESERKEVEQNFRNFLQKFDINLGVILDSIEKSSRG